MGSRTSRAAFVTLPTLALVVCIPSLAHAGDGAPSGVQEPTAEHALSSGDAGPPAAASSATPGAAPATPATDTPEVDSPSAKPSYPPTPPEFASGRPAMTEADWRKKREGVYFTGLPLINSDPDTGIGFGIRAFRFDNGRRSNDLFPYRAYESRVYAQYFETTGGLRYHALALDAPFFQDGAHRLKLDAVYDHNTAANWFGAGEAARGALVDPRNPSSAYTSMDDYVRAIRQVDDRGETYAFYNKFEVRRPTVNATWEELFLGSRLRAVAGFMFQHVTVTDPTGTTVRGLRGGTEVEARNASSLFAEQCARGVLVGCGGGFHNALKLAVSYDMRDFEPDPESGYVLEASSQFSGTATGSSDTYARGTVQARGYWSPMRSVADLVFAGRALYAMHAGDVPFFAMSTITLADNDLEGLGGRTTLRGFKQNRFVGRVAALANAELRWTFVDFRALSQRFGLMLVPFIDAGRTFDRIADTSLADYKFGYGGGFRIAWNQATIITADYGRSREGAGLYINFGHPF